MDLPPFSCEPTYVSSDMLPSAPVLVASTGGSRAFFAESLEAHESETFVRRDLLPGR